MYETDYFEWEHVDLTEFMVCGAKERWEPEDDEKFYYINFDGKIREYLWSEDETDLEMLSFGNVCKTYEEAEEKLEEVREVLRK